MYDHRSRFNPSPSTPLPPYPTVSGTLFPWLNDNGTCRDPMDLSGGEYAVLSLVLSIRPTALDKLWYEDLPSLGERAAFGGLKTLDPRARAVVWTVADVYRAFKAEKRAKRQGLDDLPAGLEGSWLKVAVETGGYLRESVLFGEEDASNARDKGESKIDADVMSLCESFYGMSIGEDNDDYFTGRARGRSLREKIDRLWEQRTGYFKDEGCTSS